MKSHPTGGKILRNFPASEITLYKQVVNQFIGLRIEEDAYDVYGNQLIDCHCVVDDGSGFGDRSLFVKKLTETKCAQ